MPLESANSRDSTLHEDQWVGAVAVMLVVMMHFSSGHEQLLLSCSMPKLWPITCATAPATMPATGEKSVVTPPEYWKVQIVPFKAFATVPFSKTNFLDKWSEEWSWDHFILTSRVGRCRWSVLELVFGDGISKIQSKYRWDLKTLWFHRGLSKSPLPLELQICSKGRRAGTW